MKQAAIMVRILKGQDYQQQVENLRAVARHQAVQVVAEITKELVVIRKFQQKEGIEQLLKLCRQGAIQKVLVSNFTHLGYSMVAVSEIMEELTLLGISVYVHSVGMETLTDDKLSSEGQMMLTAANMWACAERKWLSEASHDMIDEGRRRGNKNGRPSGIKEKAADFLEKYPAVISQLQQGLSLREVAKICGVSINTVCKVKNVIHTTIPSNGIMQ